jgi:hypothetical protein
MMRVPLFPEVEASFQEWCRNMSEEHKALTRRIANIFQYGTEEEKDAIRCEIFGGGLKGGEAD